MALHTFFLAGNYKYDIGFSDKYQSENIYLSALSNKYPKHGDPCDNYSAYKRYNTDYNGLDRYVIPSYPNHVVGKRSHDYQDIISLEDIHSETVFSKRCQNWPLIRLENLNKPVK